MATTYERLMQLHIPDIRARYTVRDTMLYALSLGAGVDPLAPEQLALVYERNLRALPTMAVVLAHPGFWARDLDSGLDWVKIVHGGQRLTMQRPLPAAGDLIGRSRIVDVIDKGPGKGALVLFERRLADAGTGEVYCTMLQTLFCRGDGGIGGSAQPLPEPHRIPDWAPAITVDHALLPQTALLYRLNGDMNPLHADPEVAHRAGFERPILHGLATYGVAGLALVHTLCEGDPTRLLDLSVRFTAPVYPGETLRTEIWPDAQGASLRVSVSARGIVAIDNGRAFIRPSTAP